MKMLEYIVSLIYPWKCVFCNSVLENGDICDECVSKLPYTKGDSIYQIRSLPSLINVFRRCTTRIMSATPSIGINSTAARHIAGGTAR